MLLACLWDVRESVCGLCVCTHGERVREREIEREREGKRELAVASNCLSSPIEWVTIISVQWLTIATTLQP